MGVNSLPKTVTRQRRGCDLNPGPSAPELSTLTTRLPSHPCLTALEQKYEKTCSSDIHLQQQPQSASGMHVRSQCPPDFPTRQSLCRHRNPVCYIGLNGGARVTRQSGGGQNRGRWVIYTARCRSFLRCSDPVGWESGRTSGPWELAQLTGNSQFPSKTKW